MPKCATPGCPYPVPTEGAFCGRCITLGNNLRGRSPVEIDREAERTEREERKRWQPHRNVHPERITRNTCLAWRRCIQSGSDTVRNLARLYGVSESTIRHHVKGRCSHGSVCL